MALGKYALGAAPQINFFQWLQPLMGSLVQINGFGPRTLIDAASRKSAQRQKAALTPAQKDILGTVVQERSSGDSGLGGESKGGYGSSGNQHPQGGTTGGGNDYEGNEGSNGGEHTGNQETSGSQERKGGNESKGGHGYSTDHGSKGGYESKSSHKSTKTNVEKMKSTSYVETKTSHTQATSNKSTIQHTYTKPSKTEYSHSTQEKSVETKPAPKPTTVHKETTKTSYTTKPSKSIETKSAPKPTTIHKETTTTSYAKPSKTKYSHPTQEKPVETQPAPKPSTVYTETKTFYTSHEITEHKSSSVATSTYTSKTTKTVVASSAYKASTHSTSSKTVTTYVHKTTTLSSSYSHKTPVHTKMTEYVTPTTMHKTATMYKPSSTATSPCSSTTTTSVISKSMFHTYEKPSTTETSTIKSIVYTISSKPSIAHETPIHSSTTKAYTPYSTSTHQSHQTKPTTLSPHSETKPKYPQTSEQSSGFYSSVSLATSDNGEGSYTCTSTSAARVTSTLVVTSTYYTSIAIPATSAAPKPCSENEFWYEEKKCCLPLGGSNLPKPSATVICPYTWEYSTTLSCCVPKVPFVPLPACPAKHTWDGKSFVCQPPSSPYPKPSSIYGRKAKSSRRSEQTPLTPCPSGLEQCPISGLSSPENDDYECVETTSDLINCGGCSAAGKGKDCTTIPNALNVACERGTCIVASCTKGYIPSTGNGTCILANGGRIFAGDLP
ncbi:hypothetical protein ACEPAF_3634 [Sanghuangporus sanghuang]